MTNSEKLRKIEICDLLCVRVFWTCVKNVAMLPEDTLSTGEIKQFPTKVLLAFLNLKNAYMKTTNLFLDLNHTFNNCTCIPTFGPPCYNLVNSMLKANYLFVITSGLLGNHIRVAIKKNKISCNINFCIN